MADLQMFQSVGNGHDDVEDAVEAIQSGECKDFLVYFGSWRPGDAARLAEGITAAARAGNTLRYIDFQYNNGVPPIGDLARRASPRPSRRAGGQPWRSWT